MSLPTTEDLISFWFSLPEEKWFRKDDTFDEELRTRFEEFLKHAARTAAARPEARSLLGLVLLFDQIPRNIYRESAQAFAFDEKALSLAKLAIAQNFEKDYSFVERCFLYLPFEHSEKIEDQNTAVELFTRLAADSDVDGESRFEPNLDFARKHRAIIERFGRFPHRNAVLGRASTAEETEFLKQPGSSF